MSCNCLQNEQYRYRYRYENKYYVMHMMYPTIFYTQNVHWPSLFASFSSPPSIHGACVLGAHQSSKSHSGRANVIQCSARCWLSQDSKDGSPDSPNLDPQDLLDLLLFDLVASVKITEVFFHHHHHHHHHQAAWFPCFFRWHPLHHSLRWVYVCPR